MTMGLALKACVAWLTLVVFAILNGAFRDKILAPLLGVNVALPISGITLSILVFLVSFFAIPYFGKNPAATFIFIGIQWVIMTLLFEFLFAHFVVGKSWQALLQVFSVTKGDLFLLVLISSLFAPYITAKTRGIL